jgi:hypothetical protein
MPSKDEALRFAAAASTSVEQLRRACAILGLPTEDGAEDLRRRLLAHLKPLDEAAPVVCLNPRLDPR